MLILLAALVFAPTHASDAQVESNDLVNRALKAWPLVRSDVDETTLGKSSLNRANPLATKTKKMLSRSASHVRSLRHIRPGCTRAGSSASLDLEQFKRDDGTFTESHPSQLRGIEAGLSHEGGTMLVPPPSDGGPPGGRGPRPEGVYGDTSSALVRRVALEGRIPELTPERWYRPPRLLRNAHVHTIVAAKLRPNEPPAWVDGALGYNRTELRTPDGGCVAVDMVTAAPVSSTRLLVLTSGLGGGSQDFYVKSMAAAATGSGWHVAVVNMRGCGDSSVTSPRFFSAHRGAIDDLELALKWVRPQVAARTGEECSALTVAVAGWSNGGSIVNNFAARHAAAIAAEPSTPRLVHAVVSMAAPLDMITADQYISRPFQAAVYNRAITANLKSLMESTLPLFGDGVVPDWKNKSVRVDLEGIARSRSIRDIDEAITRRMYGFESVDDYYREASSNQRIVDIDVPLLMVNAIDDPIASPCLPFETVRRNPKAILVATQYGGHLGWTDEDGGVSNSHKWLHGLVLGFLREALRPTSS